MSKSDGLKIGVKFTDDLVGDVSGNELAFAVGGQEYGYINGLLIDKEYVVDKVERYPVQRLWGIGNQIKLDNVIVGYTNNLVPNMTSYTTPTGVVSASSFNNHISNYPYQAFDGSSANRWVTTSTIPTGWIAYEFEEVKRIVKYTIEAHATNGSSAPKNWTLEGWDGSEYMVLDTRIGVVFANGEKKEFVFSNEKQYKKYRLNVTLNNGAAYLSIGELELCGGVYEYMTPKVYVISSIQLTGDYRVRWQEDKPIDTNIIIEYTTGEIQGQWQVISSNDVITVDTNLWIRATLSTIDTSVTPTLQDLWLEESTTPQDRILLTFDWWDKFNNVVGDLTVSYDETKGNLQGIGGAVESFEATFSPEGLVPTPNPNVEEYISVAPSIAVNFNPLEFLKAYENESDTITVAATTVTATLTDVSIINP